MKVVFLQDDSFIKLSIALLSAVLKKNGHDCDLFIETGNNNIIESALSSGADLFAFSCTTGKEYWVIRTAQELKKHVQTPIIVGGPHATFFPNLIENECIDFICRGEGEGAIVDLVDCLGRQPERISEIPNIWSKRPDGTVCENDVRCFLENLDSLPASDFDVYDRYKYIMSFNLDMYPVMTGRGCPHNCSYCFNRPYKDLYKYKGKYLRRRSPENVIEELLSAKEKYGIRQINFVDDSFLTFPKWVKEFAVLYNKHINLPFIINVEPTTVTDDLVSIVKSIGCICFRMGVESGNDKLRQIVLNKKVTEEAIRNAAKSIKGHKIKLATYNILGLPGETVENALETYLINKEIGTDFAWCSLLQIYPGTGITDYVIENGFLDDNLPNKKQNSSFFNTTYVKSDCRREIINLQKMMQLFLQFKVPVSIVRKIIRIPENPLFSLIFKVSFVYNKIRTQNIRLIPLARLAWHSLNYMK